MPPVSLKPVIASLHAAATEPGIWIEALPLITNAFDGIGSTCFAHNVQTGRVEWAYISGPVAEYKANFIEHYASLDLFIRALSAAALPGWLTLSKSLPQDVLRSNEWYQDFIRPCGIGDVLGVQLYQSGPRRVFFGIQYEAVQAASSPRDARLQLLSKHLVEAVRLGQMQRALRLKASLGTWTLDHLTDALFLICDSGYLVEMNTAAESVLSHGRALTVRQGRLVATDAANARQLDALVAAAGNTDALDVTAKRMLLGRINQHDCHMVTVFSLKRQAAADERAVVVIRVADLSGPSPAGVGLAELFGLSPAEDRLAQALLRGRRLSEMTTDFGVRMPTLRVQLRSLLQKCGVQRQVDLIRILLKAC